MVFLINALLVFLQVSEWYREGVCGGGFYELKVNLLTEDGKVSITLRLQVQQTFSGLNTDGMYTVALSNSFLSPLEKIQYLQFGMFWGDFLFYLVCSH